MPRSMFLTLKSFAVPQRGGALLLAAASFAAGLTAGALIGPVSTQRGDAVAAIQTREPQPASALRSGHPAEVVRVLDGDTFEAREMHARCDDERVKALAARAALARLLAEGSVAVSRVGQDKYGGRVDADVSTARTPNVSEALFDGGYARRYSGGRRESWCG